MEQYDVKGLFEFLQQTPESGLRKMLVDGKSFSDVHFQITMKIVRNAKSEEFEKYFQDKAFPKIKFSPNEQKSKEQFWDCFSNVVKAKGILSPLGGAKQAA
jgi:hypothetical protein